MNEIGTQTMYRSTSADISRSDCRPESLDKANAYYVHVTIPSIPKSAVADKDEAEEVSGPANFLQLQDDYLFWGPSLLRYFPRIERWFSVDARQFERSIIYRLRYLSHLVYRNPSDEQTSLQQLEIEWIWDEIMRRQLETEAWRVIDQVGIDRLHFLRDRQNFKPAQVSLWGPMKGLGQIVLVSFALCWGFYVTYWLIYLAPVTELLRRLLSLIK